MRKRVVPIMNGPRAICAALTLLAAALAAGAPGVGAATDPGAPPHPTPAIGADAALALLTEGNARFAAGAMQHPAQGKERRLAVARDGQRPFATVLTCSDSRLPVELLFDRGIGDLFVVRVAGNVSDTDEIGSMEYGAGHLGTPLIVVLGHTRCGAVTAVVKGDEVGGSIPMLVDNILPAVARSKAKGAGGDALVLDAIRENVLQSMADLLRSSAEVRALVLEKKTRLLGAIYDLESGEVSWLGEHPEQRALLQASGGLGGHH